MRIISASTWGRFVKSDAPRIVLGDVTEMTVHYTGAKSVSRGENQVASYLKAIERSQMRDSKMSAIAYNFAVDKWGRVWELRGWTFRNAANGTASNRTSFSVLCLVGVDDNNPTPAMLVGLQQLYAEGVVRSGKVLSVKGHREHKATACPGDALTQIVNSGAVQNRVAVETVPTVNSFGVYTVVRGDSWWKIAEKVLGKGSRWREIFELNGSVKTLRPGGQVRVPGDGLTPSPVPVFRTYVVQPNDSWWRIAEKTLGSGSRWVEIASLNSNIALHPGVSIEVPGD